MEVFQERNLVDLSSLSTFFLTHFRAQQLIHQFEPPLPLCEILGTLSNITMGSETISLEDIKSGADAHVQNSVVQDGEEEDAQHGAQVEAKYMGTITDQREMSILCRTQVLRVRMPQTELPYPPDDRV
jgi:hypothetical protein